MEDLCVKMFNSIQIFAGIMQNGGFEVADDAGFVQLIQNVLGRCLEKEDLCNEFFLQLIKQTTDHPDPNGRINIQNWRFLAMLVSVAAPRNKEIFDYLCTGCATSLGQREVTAGERRPRPRIPARHPIGLV